MMGSNPSTFTGNPDRPVESVSWLDVQEYIEKLRRVGRQEYRLPTELEWEYAAQSRGRSQRWAGTDNAEESDAYAWSRENSGAKTHAVGQKKGNGLGLHDMGGNVWEWCQDWYEDDSGARTVHGVKGRVIRGGSWMVDRSFVTTHSREGAAPESRSSDNGFRLVLPLLSSDQQEKPMPAVHVEEPPQAEEPAPQEGGE
jgi:formylglycine-generating enzyme required for sulfatase activity